MGRTNDAMGSNYRPFWQLLTTTPASPAPGAHSNQWWPVEDIVSSRRVSSVDSLQETMVHCTQFKGFTVHGAFISEGAVFVICSWQSEREVEVILDHTASFMGCFETRFVLGDVIIWFITNFSVSEKSLKPSAENSNTLLDIVFPEFSSKY